MINAVVRVDHRSRTSFLQDDCRFCANVGKPRPGRFGRRASNRSSTLASVFRPRRGLYHRSRTRQNAATSVTTKGAWSLASRSSSTGPNSDLLETLTNQFPDISAKEMNTAFRGAGYRCVLPSYRPPLGISATSIDRTSRRTPHSQAAAADPSNHKFAARSRRIKSREVGRFSA